jgi:hypothetical protein
MWFEIFVVYILFLIDSIVFFLTQKRMYKMDSKSMTTVRYVESDGNYIPVMSDELSIP